MKKSLIYTIVGGACLLTTTSLTLIASGIEDTNTNDNTSTNLIAVEDNPVVTTKSFDSNESVFVITDHAGKSTKSFIGSTINNSTEPIPVDLHITYSLDGTEISATDLTGKSGHIKITYDYTATKSYNGKKVPFVTVTGLALDPQKFKNIKTENGKIINESEDAILIAGYAIAGLNEDLGLDLLPSTFSLEADVENFKLSTVYTFATSDLLADLDTSKLNSIDDIIAQMNQLSNGMDQLVSGAGTLMNGLDSAASGAKTLQAGMNTLASGANELATGANTLAGGAHQLEAGAYQLSNGLGQIIDVDNQILGKINEVTTTVITKYQEIAARIDRAISTIRYISPRTATELSQVKAELEAKVTGFYDEAYSKVTTYTGGIEAAYDGASKLAAGLTDLSTGADSLADGAGKLASGANELAIGSGTLVNGLDQLASGSHTLYNGLITFKTAGIDRIVSFANNDLASLTSNIRSTVNAAKSYHYYSNSSAKSVKFLFKTPSIK